MTMFDKVYIKMAQEMSTLSSCNRRKVGAILTLDNRPIATGYNGTLPGADNCCEDSKGNTLPHTLHAEANLFYFCLRQGIRTEYEDQERFLHQGHTSKSAGMSLRKLRHRTSLYLTLSPCIQCAEMIISSGVKRVVFLEQYRCVKGLEFLKGNEVECERYEG